jgi:hypothetical protein
MADLLIVRRQVALTRKGVGSFTAQLSFLSRNHPLAQTQTPFNIGRMCAFFGGQVDGLQFKFAIIFYCHGYTSLSKYIDSSKCPLFRGDSGSLMGYGGKNGEWSIDQKIKKIRDAGFDGFVGRTAFVSAEQVAASGLIFACTTDLGGVKEIKPKLRAIKAAGARVVNVQMLDHDTPTKRGG